MSGDEAVPDPSASPFDVAFLLSQVDLEDRRLWITVLLVVWTVVHFNLLCMWEHYTRVFSQLFGSPYTACYCLSAVQIASSNARNYYFYECVKAQPQLDTPYNELFNIIGIFLVGMGAILVVTSFLRLGWTGTWHGDHFGILMDAKVTSFPFSVLEHPMYVGGKLNFLGTAIMYRSVAGVALSLWVSIIYAVAEKFEGSFTDMIYAKKAAASKKPAQAKWQKKKRK